MSRASVRSRLCTGRDRLLVGLAVTGVPRREEGVFQVDQARRGDGRRVTSRLSVSVHAMRHRVCLTLVSLGGMLLALFFFCLN